MVFWGEFFAEKKLGLPTSAPDISDLVPRLGALVGISRNYLAMHWCQGHLEIPGGHGAIYCM